MKIRMENITQFGRLVISVDLEETGDLSVPREQKAAIFETVDKLMTLVETAEHSRGPQPLELDTTVSGYSIDPQDACLCYATDAIDCQHNGCHLVEGQREWIAAIQSGCYDDAADAAFEHELTLWAAGNEALMVAPHGR